MDPAPLALLQSVRATTIVSTSAWPGAPIIEEGPGRFRGVAERLTAGASSRRDPRRARGRVRTAAAPAAGSAARASGGRTCLPPAWTVRALPPDPVLRPTH